MSTDLSAVDKKFVEKRIGDINKDLENKVKEAIDSIKEKTEKMMADAFEGKKIDADFSKELKQINDATSNLSSLTNSVADIFKKGYGGRLFQNMGHSASGYKAKKSYNYEWFEKILAKLKD